MSQVLDISEVYFEVNGLIPDKMTQNPPPLGASADSMANPNPDAIKQLNSLQFAERLKTSNHPFLTPITLEFDDSVSELYQKTPSFTSNSEISSSPHNVALPQKTSNLSFSLESLLDTDFTSPLKKNSCESRFSVLSKKVVFNFQLPLLPSDSEKKLLSLNNSFSYVQAENLAKTLAPKSIYAIEILAQLYFFGPRGFPQNLEQSHYWIQQGLSQGSDICLALALIILSNPISTQFKHLFRIAQNLCASNQPISPLLQLVIGNFLKFGILKLNIGPSTVEGIVHHQRAFILSSVYSYFREWTPIDPCDPKFTPNDIYNIPNPLNIQVQSDQYQSKPSSRSLLFSKFLAHLALHLEPYTSSSLSGYFSSGSNSFKFHGFIHLSRLLPNVIFEILCSVFQPSIFYPLLLSPILSKTFGVIQQCLIARLSQRPFFGYYRHLSSMFHRPTFQPSVIFPRSFAKTYGQFAAEKRQWSPDESLFTNHYAPQSDPFTQFIRGIILSCDYSSYGRFHPEYNAYNIFLENYFAHDQSNYESIHKMMSTFFLNHSSSFQWPNSDQDSQLHITSSQPQSSNKSISSHSSDKSDNGETKSSDSPSECHQFSFNSLVHHCFLSGFLHIKPVCKYVKLDQIQDLLTPEAEYHPFEYPMGIENSLDTLYLELISQNTGAIFDLIHCATEKLKFHTESFRHSSMISEWENLSISAYNFALNSHQDDIVELCNDAENL